jgi:hypothetical protein
MGVVFDAWQVSMNSFVFKPFSWWVKTIDAVFCKQKMRRVECCCAKMSCQVLQEKMKKNIREAEFAAKTALICRDLSSVD